jgi:hypothetical protein
MNIWKKGQRIFHQFNDHSGRVWEKERERPKTFNLIISAMHSTDRLFLLQREAENLAPVQACNA